MRNLVSRKIDKTQGLFNSPKAKILLGEKKYVELRESGENGVRESVDIAVDVVRCESKRK